MVTVEEIFANIKTKLSACLTDINTQLTAKGQTAANSLKEVPEKIKTISNGKQVLSGTVNSTEQDVDAPTYNYKKSVSFPFLGNLIFVRYSTVEDTETDITGGHIVDSNYMTVSYVDNGYGTIGTIGEGINDNVDVYYTIANDTITINIIGDETVMRLTNQYKYVTWSN